MCEEVILKAENIEKVFKLEGYLGTSLGKKKAVDDVSFNLKRGEILGIVGESGSGKTTLAKIICNLEKQTSGRIVWYLDTVRRKYSNAQMVFQNPFSSLNPKLNIRYMMKEAISCGTGIGVFSVKDEQVRSVLSKVGMEDIDLMNYPHQFSGGQRQRLGIARSLSLGPEVIVCDEPVSALDISVQAQIINLLIEINRDMKLTIIFIAHDIEVIGVVSHNIMVMKGGKVVEYGNKKNILDDPKSEYTKLLLDSVPKNPWI
ncbi:ABC transporter ATP-binding protein [Elusimicrobiota bacterium]